ncbi:MAG: phosphatase PAP2 family protein [Chlamydiia bacterium]|nr:phosphatase PAP2 family protein [Chlamydiia bacterium]
MNLKKLLIPPLILFAMWASWLNPQTRPYWDLVDQKTFTFLNSWVHHSPFWQNFWAFAGHRMMDWIHDIAMLLFFFFSIKWASKEQKMKKVAELIFSILFIALVICMVNGVLFPEFIHIPRKSPTMVDKTAFRLGTVIDWITVKDHSRKSFPGDHATMAVLFASLIFHLMGKRAGILATLYAIFFCLPRLIVGAHWLTDNLIGSATIALLATSLAFGTPLASKLIALIEKGLSRTFRKRDHAKSLSNNQ